MPGYAQNDPQLILSFESINYSEATSLHSISGRWSDSISAGNGAWTISRLTLGYQDQRFVLQALMRDDSYYQYANDTAQILYLAENHLALEQGHDYPLNIKSNKLSSEGLRFGLKTEINKRFNIAAFISLLRPTNILQGGLDGNALAIDTNDYDLSFTSDLVYRDDPLYDRATQNIRGEGYAIDLTMDYRLNERWAIQLELLDIAGELSIDKAPFTRAEATSDIKTYDEDGFVTYNPAITGREGFRSYTHQFSRQTHLSVDYRLENNNNLIFQHHDMLDLSYQKIIYQQRFDDNLLSWRLIPKVKALGLSYKTPYFSIGLESDSLDYKKIKFLSLSTQLYWSF